MKPVPRIIESLDNLQSLRRQELLNIFAPIAHRKKNITVNNISVTGNIIFGILEGSERSSEFKSWRFQTISQNITASYHEIWINLGRGKYFMERSYFHLYTLIEKEFKEIEYILLHCDASEPDYTPHCLYKQSPHIHIKAAEQPIPKAHFALFNGRLKEVLKNRLSFNIALEDSIKMLGSQILEALPPV